MKCFLFIDPLDGSGHVSRNVLWPHFQAIGESFETQPVTIPLMPAPSAHWAKRRLIGAEVRRETRRITDTVRQAADETDPSLLLVWALKSHHVKWVRALEEVWDSFSHKVLWIGDALYPDAVDPRIIQRFDLVCCFSTVLSDAYRERFGTKVMFCPAHTDVLNHANDSAVRPIDLIVVGRRDASLHGALHLHYTRPESSVLSLDFVTRTSVPRNCQTEYGMLMSTLAKSKLAFCTPPGGERRFRNMSPLMGRWVHAWTSGCLVIGLPPTEPGARALMDWTGAMTILPTNPQAAIATVDTLLADHAALHTRRTRNVVEALRRHDTRLRLQDMLDALGLQTPEKLGAGLERLEASARSFERRLP